MNIDYTNEIKLGGIRTVIEGNNLFISNARPCVKHSACIISFNSYEETGSERVWLSAKQRKLGLNPGERVQLGVTVRASLRRNPATCLRRDLV